MYTLLNKLLKNAKLCKICKRFKQNKQKIIFGISRTLTCKTLLMSLIKFTQ